MKNGTCKFGTTCKFDHPGAAKSSAARPSAAPLAERAVSRSEVFGTTAPLNSKGLPLRPVSYGCNIKAENLTTASVSGVAVARTMLKHSSSMQCAHFCPQAVLKSASAECSEGSLRTVRGK
jgi:hypothetical protein